MRPAEVREIACDIGTPTQFTTNTMSFIKNAAEAVKRDVADLTAKMKKLGKEEQEVSANLVGHLAERMAACKRCASDLQHVERCGLQTAVVPGLHPQALLHCRRVLAVLWLCPSFQPSRFRWGSHRVARAVGLAASQTAQPETQQVQSCRETQRRVACLPASSSSLLSLRFLLALV
jgi:hypothetical protein